MKAERLLATNRAAALALLAGLVMLTPVAATAQVPDTLAYSGYLTDSQGTPYQGQVEVIAELWSGQRDGTMLWGETHARVDVANGWFGLEIGSEEPIDLDWTATNALYLQLTIEGEPIEPRQRVHSVVFAQVAETAGGALAAYIDDIDDRVATIERDGAGGVDWTEIRNRPTGLDDGDDISLGPVEWSDLTGIPASFQDGTVAWNELTGVPRDVVAIAGNNDALDVIGNDVTVSGYNVHIRNGLGSTSRTNGRGNLIVGYNSGGEGRLRTGSHNLILGDEHAYSGTAGIVAGTHNDILADGASILGGSNNSAQGEGSVVLAGTGNDAVGDASTVFGGTGNDAVGAGAAVVGGDTNRAEGDYAVVLGGRSNIALGEISVVAAGTSGRAEGDGSSIAGGIGGFAIGVNSQVLGGASNRAIGENSVVVGGVSNRALCIEDVAVGGSGNVAGAGTEEDGGGFVCVDTTSAATIVGGSESRAGGVFSATLAGLRSRATGEHSAVVGGDDNSAAGDSSVVVGGFLNQANAERSVILSGDTGTAEGNSSTILGGVNGSTSDFYEIWPTELGP